MTKKVCPRCYIAFEITDEMANAKRVNGSVIHCPNGHGFAVCKSDNTLLREQLEKCEERLVSARRCSEGNYLNWMEEYRRRCALKGVITKMRNKIAKREGERDEKRKQSPYRGRF